MANFKKAFDYLMVNEGGFSNHASDRGGATRYGITRETASRWRRQSVSVEQMKNFPLQEAMDIYEAWYWKTVGCDQITHDGIATALFDIGVVRGIGVPQKYAQEICNAHGWNLVLDGHVGIKTITAINQIKPEDFIHELHAKFRNGFLAIVAKRPTQAVFLKGWLNRAKRLLTLV